MEEQITIKETEFPASESLQNPEIVENSKEHPSNVYDEQIVRDSSLLPGSSEKPEEFHELAEISSQNSGIIVQNHHKERSVDQSRHHFEGGAGSGTDVDRFDSRQGKDPNLPNLAKGEAFIYMIIPPDGGYAWLVLVMAFLCQVIVDGILFSIGILLPAIASELAFSYKQTALIASTQIGVFCLTAPLGSAFINRFGFRRVAIFGSLISSIGILVASFSDLMATLIFFYGILAGSAMGLIWISTSLVINYYFERYRPLVGGVASSGSGVGVICVSLLNKSLVDQVGWRVTARVHVILLLVAGLLVCTYREVKLTKVGQFVDLILDEDSDEVTMYSTEIASDRYSVYVSPINGSSKSPVHRASNENNIESRMELETVKTSFLQHICPCFYSKKRRVEPESQQYVIRHDPLDRDDIFYDGPPNYDQTRPNLENMDIFTVEEHKVQSVSYSLSLIRRPTQDFEEEKKSSWIPKKLKTAFVILFDMQLLTRREFQLLLVEAFFFPMGLNIPFVYSTERAEIDQNSAKLLPVIIGLTNVVLRISLGITAYNIQLHTAYVSGGGIILGGLVTLLSGFVGQRSEIFQFFFALSFGVAAASYSALRAIVYVKILGLESLTNAFGLTEMVMGIGFFIGTNVAGTLNDISAGYAATFVFSGTCMIIAGIVKLSLPKYVGYLREKEANRVHKKVRFAKNTNRGKWWRRCCS